LILILCIKGIGNGSAEKKTARESNPFGFWRQFVDFLHQLQIKSITFQYLVYTEEALPLFVFG